MKSSFFMPSTWVAIFGDPGAVNALAGEGAGGGAAVADFVSDWAPHPPIASTATRPTPPNAYLIALIEAPIWTDTRCFRSNRPPREWTRCWSSYSACGQDRTGEPAWLAEAPLPAPRLSGRSRIPVDAALTGKQDPRGTPAGPAYRISRAGARRGTRFR